ncbi:recombinase family protein [Devosia beringensis]|uniref:recombinase family protein n=1 Tax=Devosia beringensis TaxID=2657486 RepID=UPI00186BA6F7|nr:recombinase family protein [Devosia beringensis]
MFIRAYLRASTEEQDATRAKAALERFCEERGLKVAAFYVENESGAKLDRPELFRLLEDCHPGDILLTEQVDRLSRLRADDWERLKGEIRSRGVKVVALDLPPSYQMATSADEYTAWMVEAFNNMMLDMLALFARKDYVDRRRRAAEGIAKAKANGVYKGRPEDEARNTRIMDLLRQGWSYGSIQEHMAHPMTKNGKAVFENGKRKMSVPSAHTIAKLAKRLKEESSE